MPGNPSLRRALRALAAREESGKGRFVFLRLSKLEETVKWGNGCWVLDGLPIVFIYVAPDHVQFGFFAGAMLKDPKERLQGKGQYVRSVPVFEKKDIDKDYFVKLIKQAEKIKYK